MGSLRCLLNIQSAGRADARCNLRRLIVSCSNMARYITFRFDDGHIAGARTAAKLPHPDRASFFIITGPIEGTIDLTNYPLLASGKYGDLAAWKSLAASGNDIQPHSETHPKFSEISSTEQEVEIRHSLEFVRKIHDGPYIFCYPYNVVPASRPLVNELSASGFRTAVTPSDAAANLIANGLDFFDLQSWEVKQSNLDLILSHLAETPDNAWVVLGLHSLNGEGHDPLTSEQLSKLIDAGRNRSYEIVTVAEMIRRHHSN
jgi:peptidoglycan/xylan/chitin deacetylase (PgdA/CDA1 family)